MIENDGDVTKWIVSETYKSEHQFNVRFVYYFDVLINPLHAKFFTGKKNIY